MNPLISVIVPTYNRRSVLCECLDAIIEQSYKPLEIIVVDDGSTDDTVEYVRKNYTGVVTCIELPHSGLPAVSRNAGLAVARGAYIAFCDSDDIWMPSKMEQQMVFLVNGEYNLVCCDALILGTEQRYLANVKFQYKDLRKELLWNNYIITSSVIISAELMNHARFSTHSAYRGYEDYALWMNLCEVLHIMYINRPLLWYRLHDTNISGEIKTSDAAVQLQLAFRYISPLRHPLLLGKKVLKYWYHRQ